MGFNPFTRHRIEPIPAESVEAPAELKVAVEKPAPAARPARAAHRMFDPFAGHGKKQFRLVRKDRIPPAQKLLDWIRDWPHPFIGLREIVLYGPNSIRNRDHAISLAETLVGHGWLTPVTCRRDTKVWKIIRGPSGYPIVADLPVNVATNVAPVGE
jgi:hypothetical protein